MDSLGDLYLRDVRSRMAGLKALGEGAMRQLAPEHWHAAPGPEENSVAVLVQHLSGNMHSRWEHFLSEDGEAAGRDRDAEFEDASQSAVQLQQRWEAGWAVFLGVLERLEASDLTRTLTIRGEVHTVLEAIQRQVMHYSGHVYQIVLLCRHWAGPNWQTLSIARGGSAEFNRQMEKQKQG